MNVLYIVGLVSIILLFIWKKYTSHTKRRNEYIKYLQEQNKKLQTVIQDPSQPIHEMNPENSIQNQDMQAMGMPEFAFILNQLQSKQQPPNTANVEELKEDFVDVNKDDEMSDCELPDFETEETPEKVPLMNERKPPIVLENEGKCSLKPLLESNFADVPEALYDKPSISVSENDPNNEVKAANTDDNRKFLEKDELLEESLEELLQTKQMHCTGIVRTGKNKGSVCGKKANKEGLCKQHLEK